MKPGEEVRSFYEKMPYPPPVANLDQSRDVYSPDRSRALRHLFWPTGAPRTLRNVLVAGCGTSQAIRHALREPLAYVTAIDISTRSLERARDLQRQYGLVNVEFHELAITDV